MREFAGVRLERKYITGIELIKRQKVSEGLDSPTRTDVIKEGLDVLFKQYKITSSVIREELKKHQE